MSWGWTPAGVAPCNESLPTKAVGAKDHLIGSSNVKVGLAVSSAGGFLFSCASQINTSFSGILHNNERPRGCAD